MTDPSRSSRLVDRLLDKPSWAPSWMPSVDEAWGRRWLRWLTGAVFLAGLGGCMLRSADSPADPQLGSRTGVPGADSLASSFGQVLVELVTGSGKVLALCMLHADTSAERGRGLMGVTDLEGSDGMVFVNDADVVGEFYMYRTVTPLTVSWWTSDGSFVNATDMEPCTSTDPAACQRYPAGAPYRYAVEVFRGAEVAAEFQTDSTLRVGGACPPR